jgi:hypothetical protein
MAAQVQLEAQQHSALSSRREAGAAAAEALQQTEVLQAEAQSLELLLAAHSTTFRLKRLQGPRVVAVLEM